MNFDRSQPSVAAAVESGAGTAKASSAGVPGPKAVSFAARDVPKAESVVSSEQEHPEDGDTGLPAQRNLRVAGSKSGSTSRDGGAEEETGDMIVLDMIEEDLMKEELSARGVIVGGIDSHTDEAGDGLESQPSIYESNSPQVCRLPLCFASCASFYCFYSH